MLQCSETKVYKPFSVFVHIFVIYFCTNYFAEFFTAPRRHRGFLQKYNCNFLLAFILSESVGNGFFSKQIYL